MTAILSEWPRKAEFACNHSVMGTLGRQIRSSKYSSSMEVACAHVELTFRTASSCSKYVDKRQCMHSGPGRARWTARNQQLQGTTFMGQARYDIIRP